ncbi:MAG: hypothetical protein ABIJ12_13365 [bacterium]
MSTFIKRNYNSKILAGFTTLIIVLLLTITATVEATNVVKPFQSIKSVEFETSAIQVSVSSTDFNSLKNIETIAEIEFPISFTENLNLEMERFNIITPTARFLRGDGSTLPAPDVVLF